MQVQTKMMTTSLEMLSPAEQKLYLQIWEVHFWVFFQTNDYGD